MVIVELFEGELTRETAVDFSPAGSGAVLRFDGVVRGEEDGRELVALDYEVYEPMTTRELRRLATAVVAEFGIDRIGVWHSVGAVRVGRISFVCCIGSKHRAEGLAAMGAFIARMKRAVPIWKNPVFAGGNG